MIILFIAAPIEERTLFLRMAMEIHHCEYLFALFKKVFKIFFNAMNLGMEKGMGLHPATIKIIAS